MAQDLVVRDREGTKGILSFYNRTFVSQSQARGPAQGTVRDSISQNAPIPAFLWAVDGRSWRTCPCSRPGSFPTLSLSACPMLVQD